MKELLQTILRWLSRLILWKYQPVIVAITGSVGKTSAKEAIFCVVNKKFRARKSQGNYNNEIGVPLTVIGAATGGRNFLRWLWVLLKGFLVFILPLPYPRVLVLEMGADRPGDIGYLTSFVRPDVAVVTAVGPSHLEFFGKVEKIAEEKSKLVSGLKPAGTAVLNYDDERLQAMSVKSPDKVIFYGLDQDADLIVSDIVYKGQSIMFKVHYAGNVVPVQLRGVVGKPSLYAALAAFGVGLALDINMVDIANALVRYQSPPGRLRFLHGVKQTVIVDDTYNSAPASAKLALEVLRDLPGERKIAILGNMEELGKFTEDGHREVGAAVVDYGISLLVTVGLKAKFISDQARHMGYSPEQILEFRTSEQAKKPVERLIQPGDAILVKGSQSMRMEKIVKEIMSEPERADELLCRQGSSWQD